MRRRRWGGVDRTGRVMWRAGEVGDVPMVWMGEFQFPLLVPSLLAVTTISDLPCAHGVSSGACFGWLANIMPSLHHPSFYFSLLRFVSFRYFRYF